MAAPATAPRRAPAKRAPTPKRPATRKSAPPTRSQRNQRALANARATQRAGAAPATRTPPARRKSGAAPRTVTAPRPVVRVIQSRGMPLIDRLLRGPAWVAIVGVLLAGIVLLNVSVLELNRGIARTDASSDKLERTNSGLRTRVARLDSGERIAELAAARGFVMPQPGDVTFVKPSASNAKLAAQRIRPPSEVAAPETTAGAEPTAAEPPAADATTTTTTTTPPADSAAAAAPVAQTAPAAPPSTATQATP